MTLKECYLIKNKCYLKNEKMTGRKPMFIVVHSTGCNNKSLKRYVQPVREQSCYNKVISDIGLYDSPMHWNTYQPIQNGKKISVCVHAFIGENARGEVETYQTLPSDVVCWGCGSGEKGSFNYNPTAAFQLEICEDDRTDELYFNRAMKEAAELCAFVCRQYSLTVDRIVSHREAHKLGYASDHSDPDKWMSVFGYTMNDFRKWTSLALDGKTIPLETKKKAAKADTYEIVASALTIRQKPTILSKAVDYLKKGDIVQVAEISGTWGKLADNRGWIGIKEKYARRMV